MAVVKIPVIEMHTESEHVPCRLLQVLLWPVEASPEQDTHKQRWRSAANIRVPHLSDGEGDTTDDPLVLVLTPRQSHSI